MMNFALTERYLSLFSTKHTQAYYTLLVQDPWHRFGVTFTYFMNYLVCEKKQEIYLNRNSMKAP